MDGIAEEPARPARHEPDASVNRKAQLAQVIDMLEDNLRTLESLGLTLVVALLDHAIAEAKLQLEL